MASTEKVAYQPSQSRRFKISADPCSQERARAVHAAVREVSGMHPFIVGAILFGSLSKGKVLDEKTAGKTDIDLCVYLDPDLLYQGLGGLTNDNHEYQRVKKSADQLFGPWGIMRKTPPQKRLLMSVAFYLGELIFEKIDSLLSAGNKLPQQPKEAPFKEVPFINAISLNGEYSIEEVLKRTFEYYQNLAEFLAEDDRGLSARLYSPLALPWGLDILGGMGKYRKAYLDKLSALSIKEADLHWKAVNHAVKFYERKWKIPDGISRFYPDTFADAVQFYCR